MENSILNRKNGKAKKAIWYKINKILLKRFISQLKEANLLKIQSLNAHQGSTKINGKKIKVINLLVGLGKTILLRINHLLHQHLILETCHLLCVD